MKNFKTKLILYFILIFISITIVSGCENLIIDNVTSFEIHFIDVDQGDAMLIRTPSGKNILVDSGSQKNSHLLFSYLDKFLIPKFDVVIATHPDGDHIGSMERIIREYNISAFYMPNKAHNTNTFKYMLEALKDYNVNVVEAKEGQIIEIDEDTKIYILHPDDSFYDDNNAYSIVTKVVYKNNSFMLTGDIDHEIEKKLVYKYGDFLKSDILKLAHHGSASSSSKIFVQTVDPIAAIVSAGKNNDYSHPHKEVLQLAKNNDIPLYRTDEQGSIVFYSDGNNLNVNLSTPGSYRYKQTKK